MKVMHLTGFQGPIMAGLTIDGSYEAASTAAHIFEAPMLCMEDAKC